MLHLQQPFAVHAALLVSTSVDPTALSQNGLPAARATVAALALVMKASFASNNLHWSLHGIFNPLSPSHALFGDTATHSL